MLGSMLVNVVVNVARISDSLCTSSGCREGRSLLPWLIGLAALVVTLAVARLFGPVFVSPATASWLLPTPISRVAVLRPRLVWTLALAIPGAAALAALGSTLAGFGPGPITAFSVSVGLLAAAGVGLAALSQTMAVPASRVLNWLLAALLWVGLLLLALGAAPALTAPDRAGLGWILVTVLAAALLVACVVLALRRLARLRDRDIAPGGSLAPGLSGALAMLDFALLYDVLLAHRWRGHAAIRSRRNRHPGIGALIWTDVLRLRRSPQVLLVLAASAVTPYAVAATGAGRVVVVVVALTGFLAGLPLLVALRVLTRTPSLLQMLPFPVAEARRAALRVPGTLLIVFGLISVPALHQSIEVTWSDAAVIGVAVGLSALASAVRWITGRPPDYSRPLVSTPAGGVPTNLYGSAFRGFDVLLLSTAPLLLSPTANGAIFTGLIALAVLGYLTGRK